MTLTFLRKGDLPHRFLPSVLVGVALALGAVVIQHGSNVAAKLLATKIPFDLSKTDWSTAHIGSMPAGVYFVSLGRPRGICDLYVSNNRVATNRGILPNLRGKILIGAAFRNTTGDVNLEVRCEREAGMTSVGFSHTPILSSYGVGLFLHGWRNFTETLFGPLASLLLLCAVAFGRRSRSRLSRVRHRWAYVGFAVLALGYTLTVADFPRLFLPAMTSSWLLVSMTILFNLGLYTVCGFHSRVRALVVDSYGILLVAFGALAVFMPEQFHVWAARLLPLLAVGTAISVRDLGVSKLESESGLIYRYLASAWLFAQLAQFATTTIGVGPMFMPATATLIALVAAITYRRQVARLERVEGTVVQILRVIQTPLAASAKLAEISSLVSASTHFERASAYLDAYVLGLRDKSQETYVRVMERGYRKETSKDRYIEFSEDRGGVMRKALAGKVPVLEKGTRDGAWYVNVPIGSGACINLSDARPKADYLAYESFAILKRMLPSFLPLGEAFHPPSVKGALGLEAVRDKRGLGTFEVELGSVYVDVDDYDSNRVRFKDPYGLFIESIYFPALVRKASPFAVREWTNRDELHLVCLDELLPGKAGIAAAAHNLIGEVFEFAAGEGAALCAAHGYDPVSLHVGASWGKGRLVCATDFVRVDGEPVQRAATLQKAANRGGALVDASLVKQWPTSHNGPLRWEQATDDVAKATKLDAYRSTPEKAPDRRAA